MSILGTGRNTLAQADYASKASTALANDLQANKAGIEIAGRNANEARRGQALGSAMSTALTAAPYAYNALTGAGETAAAASGIVGNGLGQAGNAALNGSLTAANAGLTSGAATTGAATTGAAAGTTAAAASEAAAVGTTAAASSAAAGGAAAGGAAAAVVPIAGWIVAAGALAYSLFG